MNDSLLTECAAVLRAQAERADGVAAWPAEAWQALAGAGFLGAAIPTEYGGLGWSTGDLLAASELLAGACLTTCFILSQRDAAVRRIVDSGRPDLARELLRPLACGGRFATVGLSHLSTSRQHQQPPLTARETGGDLVLDGYVPWVTGAAEADHFVIGAVLDDGRQVLLAVPAPTAGVQVGPPLDLMALQGSLTAELRLSQVRVPGRWLLAGPAAKVMATGRGGSGGLETSCLALGLAGAAIDYLHAEAAARPELRLTADRLHADRLGVRQELHRLASAGGDAEAAAALRTRANHLVLRATQAALTAAKGAGFLRQHPAQRWARQALFFLVWSCPRPVAEATLASLAPPPGPECS
jgi:alkylation response protein AidB-like acyl-CoA dehydrogenase